MAKRLQSTDQDGVGLADWCWVQRADTTNVGMMLGQRSRRCTSIEPTLV